MAFWKQENEGAAAAMPTSVPLVAAMPLAAAAPISPPPPVETNLTAVPAVRQSLGRETTVTGKLSFNAPTRIDGTLNGEVKATELLIIGEEGLVDGAVRAQQLLVLGQVRGEVYVEGKVEIAPSGRIIGSVESQFLVVSAGGTLDGPCKISGRKAA